LSSQHKKSQTTNVFGSLKEIGFQTELQVGSVCSEEIRLVYALVLKTLVMQAPPGLAENP
jgi:hypothetical protein